MQSTAGSQLREREEALGQFGHDVRNALNAMTAALAVLELFPPGSSEAHEAQQVLARQVARLHSIIDERLPPR